MGEESKKGGNEWGRGKGRNLVTCGHCPAHPFLGCLGRADFCVGCGRRGYGDTAPPSLPRGLSPAGADDCPATTQHLLLPTSAPQAGAVLAAAAQRPNN